MIVSHTHLVAHVYADATAVNVDAGAEHLRQFIIFPPINKLTTF